MSLRKKFQQYDIDHSGFITKENLKTVAQGKVTDKEIEQVIAKIDTNKDGKVSFEEFLDAL